MVESGKDPDRVVLVSAGLESFADGGGVRDRRNLQIALAVEGEHGTATFESVGRGS
jgi:hypothetical protein